jgi:hypothetical protein
MESLKVSCPTVNAGAPPLGVTETPKVRLSRVTPAPNDRPIEHETPLPAAA